MRLLIFCPYYPPHIGGLESHADEFNKYLSQAGVDITVFTPRLPKDAPEKEIRHNNVKVIRFPAFEIISGYPLPRFWNLRFWKLFFGLFKEEFNIVISRTRFFNTSLLAFIFAKIKSVRWIHIEHGSDFVKLTSKLKTSIASLYDHTFGRLIFKSSDLNISISKSVQKFVGKFDKRKSPVIYRGLDFEEIDKICPDVETKNKYAGKIIIAFAGRLYKWKGIENSVLAIKSLPQEIKNKIIFLIIGDGEDFTHLQKLSKGEETIKMPGNLPREKAISILKITDVYLHSSCSGGGLSTSLLEAMYCGCAIVATSNEGANEIMDKNENDFLMAKSNPALISEKLKKLLDNKDFSTRKEVKNIVSKKFNWENSVGIYLKLFQNIGKQHNGQN